MYYIAVVDSNTVSDILCRDHGFTYHIDRYARLGNYLSRDSSLTPPEGHVFVNFTLGIWEDVLSMLSCSLVYCDLESVYSILLLPKDVCIHQEYLRDLYERSFNWE